MSRRPGPIDSLQGFRGSSTIVRVFIARKRWVVLEGSCRERPKRCRSGSVSRCYIAPTAYLCPLLLIRGAALQFHLFLGLSRTLICMPHATATPFLLDTHSSDFSLPVVAASTIIDDQVFEQMMRRASERPTMHAAMPANMSMSLCSPSSSALASPSSNGYGFVMPLGTPSRRLSSCVVARDGGGEFFAQSPAPGRPASFFR